MNLSGASLTKLSEKKKVLTSLKKERKQSMRPSQNNVYNYHNLSGIDISQLHEQ